MYEKNDKRRLYELMDMFINGLITATVFCDEFYYSYDLEINTDSLTEKEQQTFSDLSKVCSRFSKFEDDLVKYPQMYYSENELRQKILETKTKLSE